MDYDFYSLRVLCAIVETGSFSTAARKLGLTQPTVSQQISKMEQKLTARLFERVGREVHLTEAGRQLHQFALDILSRGDAFTEDLSKSRANPSGLVRYAMPESCQWTPHYRKIMSQIKALPEISFDIGILPSDLIVQHLLEGKIDFGFVVGERLNPEIRFEKFADEHYSAVAAETELLKPLHGGDFKTLRLVGFPGWELFFEAWAKAHGLWKTAKSRLATPTVRIGTLAGAIHATQEGAGVAILPTHCILEELRAKRLRTLPKLSPNATNPIYVVRRIGDTLPRRSQIVLDMLKKSKQGEPKKP